MKKILIPLCVFFLSISIAATPNEEKGLATVNKMHGYYLFTDSRPNYEYQVLTTLESKRVNMDIKSLESYSLSYDQLKEEIFRLMDQKKNKEKCTGAEAIILYPEQQKADIIKFK